MHVYLDLLILLNFTVDFLLLLGASKLTHYRCGIVKVALASALGGAYAGLCMIPSFRFLNQIHWRIAMLCLLSVIAYGANRSALRRGALFVLLSMTLGGVTMALGNGGFMGIALSAIILAGLCYFGFFGNVRNQKQVQAELVYQGQTYHLTALYDTGNTLRDPVTGQQVLIVGPEIGWDILGLTPAQLSDPVCTLSKWKGAGLRLIPYRAVGQSGGMLLALRFDEVRIEGERVGDIVAFSPNSFGKEAAYQALTGG